MFSQSVLEGFTQILAFKLLANIAMPYLSRSINWFVEEHFERGVIGV